MSILQVGCVINSHDSAVGMDIVQLHGLRTARPRQQAWRYDQTSKTMVDSHVMLYYLIELSAESLTLTRIEA